MAMIGGRNGASPLPPGILARVIRTWRNPRRVMHAQASLSEGGLFAILFMAMTLAFLAQLPVRKRAAILDPTISFEMWSFGSLVGVIIAALMAYVLAGLVALMLGRRISGHGSRVALFWSALAVSPLMLVSGLAEGYLGPVPAILVLRIGIFAAFIWFWFTGIRAFWVR